MAYGAVQGFAVLHAGRLSIVSGRGGEGRSLDERRPSAANLDAVFRILNDVGVVYRVELDGNGTFGV